MELSAQSPLHFKHFYNEGMVNCFWAIINDDFRVKCTAPIHASNCSSHSDSNVRLHNYIIYIIIIYIAYSVFFFCSGTGCLILAFNRFGEMLRIRPIIWLFKVSPKSQGFLKYIFEGSRAYWVLGACTIPVCLLVLFTPLMLFNSTHHMLFFDPMIFDGKFSVG